MLVSGSVTDQPATSNRFDINVHQHGIIHQGKSRWHGHHVLDYISHVLTHLLGTVPCTLIIGYLAGISMAYLVFCWSFFIFNNNKATSLTFCSWLKGDRPDNGDIKPSSDQPKKSIAVEIFTSVPSSHVCTPGNGWTWGNWMYNWVVYRENRSPKRSLYYYK